MVVLTSGEPPLAPLSRTAAMSVSSSLETALVPASQMEDGLDSLQSVNVRMSILYMIKIRDG